MAFSNEDREQLAPVRLYRELEEGEQLVVFGDPAESHDFCAAVAMSKKHNDCPLIFNSIMESSQFGYELNNMCRYIFNKTQIWPKLAVERNTGQATIYVLKTLNYPDLFRMVDFAASTSMATEQGDIGWLTTGYWSGGELQGTRRKMLDDLALAIKQGVITLYDEQQIKQMMSFMIVRGRAQAKANKHDDLCFVKGTLVLTDKGQVPIEKIKIGDKVLTRRGYRQVVKTFNRLADVISHKGLGLVGTSNHPIFTTQGIKPLGKIVANDTIYMWNAKLLSIKVKKITELWDYTKRDYKLSKKETRQSVYNLQIADTPEYFANNILVHNCFATAGAWQVHQITPAADWGEDFDPGATRAVREKWRFR